MNIIEKINEVLYELDCADGMSEEYQKLDAVREYLQRCGALIPVVVGEEQHPSKFEHTHCMHNGKLCVYIGVSGDYRWFKDAMEPWSYSFIVLPYHTAAPVVLTPITEIHI